MKKFLCCLLAALMLFGTAGCAVEETAPDTTEAESAPEVAETVPTEAVQTEAAPAETTEPEYEGRLFLKVSAVNLSVVGDTEDIYLGLVPREAVTWESDDESVVTVADGILTAVGVGSTTVRAIYRDQVVECAAGCLANTQEELLQLDEEIIRAPRRLPPEVDLEEETTLLDDACIIGDSITYFLFQWENKYHYMGNVVFFARGGISLNGFVYRLKNVFYRGNEMYLEDAIAASGVKRAFVMLGQNDLDSNARDKVMENWDIVLGRIREKAPDVEIIIQSSIPRLGMDKASQEKNRMVTEYNQKLYQYALENGCKYVDLAYYIKDHTDRMALCYNQGDYHMNEQGCLVWMKVLRYYSEFENEGGILQ